MSYISDRTTNFFKPRPGKRHNIIIVALEHYPSGLFKTGIGITLLAAPLLLKFFEDLGVDSLAMRIVLNGVVIVVVPAFLLFIVTLFRAPKIRLRVEAEQELSVLTASEGLEAIKEQELRDVNEMARMEKVVASNRNKRQVKDRKEDARWTSLIERLQVQEKRGQKNSDLREERDAAQQELLSKERLLAAKRVKELTDEREVARQELASGDIRAQHKARADGEEREVARQVETASVNRKARIDEERREVARQQETASVNLKARDDQEKREVARQEETASFNLKSQVDQEKREVARQEETASFNLKSQVDRENREVARQQQTASFNLQSQRAQEKREVARQEETASVNLKARDDQERREVARQEETASVDLKAWMDSEQRDIARQEETASVNLKARDDQERREVARQEETASVDLKAWMDSEQRDIARQEETASVDLKAQMEKERMDDDRWIILHERLRIQEAKNAERDADQLRRDNELQLMREAQVLRDKYKTLFERYNRHAARQGLSEDVADGLAPIPEAWLKAQPEILRDPSLLKALRTYNSGI